MVFKRGLLLLLAALSFGLGSAAFAFRLFPAVRVSGQENMELSFPFSVPGTPLIAQELRSYSGLYLEDGGRENVAGIAACILENSGSALIQNATLELWQGSRRYEFRLEYLPPGERVLVLEASRQKLLPGNITQAQGVSQEASKGIPGLVTLRQIPPRALLVTNPGPIPLRDLTLYFKNYDWSAQLFMGGIAYEINIAHLSPGEIYYAEPFYYDSENSRIVKIKTSGR